MQIHDLIQGTPEWNIYRAAHFNASDAPAMLGRSPYKTRTELLHERHTGLAQEIDAGTQARFDAGHRFEALTRPRAEAMIGQELYPVIGSAGKLSASFDGLTMMEDIVWEHKTMNDAIRAAATAQELPEYLRIQMDQQLLISGAERALFSASRWDATGSLQEEKHLWYEGDAALQAEIVAGWEQFDKDLAAYVPATTVEKPVAEAIMALPALVVQTRGEVVSSNLAAYKVAAERFIANIKTDLVDDEDFANAEATVRFCDGAEKDLEQAKSAALAQTSSIDEVMRTIDHIKGQLRAKRLALTKLIDTEKQRRKETIYSEGRRSYADHITELEKEIAPLRLQLAQPDFAGAMKSKRTLKSLQDAVDTTLANAKIAASTQAADYRAKQAWCKEHAAGHGALFMDMATIITKPMDDFQLVITTRIAAHQAAEAKKEADMRAQIAAQEKAKAEAAAAETLRVQQAEAARIAAAKETAIRQAAADEARRQLQASESRAAAPAAVPASAAPEVARTASFYGETRAADPARAAQLQLLADQNVADKREFAQVERVTGVPLVTRPYPAVGTAPAAMLDAIDVELHPTDEKIIELGADFGLTPTEWLTRLERFIAAVRAGHVAIAA
ncbi:MAG: YqaJ viral recombinase family protein [Burkholderiaceae bacterium]|nr:YqaJ viral recombinase family protein [Burkholderiaceae bacterium]